MIDRYNYLEKVLHHILLGNKYLKKIFFDIEKILFLKKILLSAKYEKHIFISGLPRSGSTFILNYLYSTKKFSTITYRNMPFVMAINTFSKLNNNKKFEKTERYHKDGVKFDIDSPESFDEIFFSTFNNEEAYNELENFLNLVNYNKGKTRYLSKNNLNYKRFLKISFKLPNSIFIIPYREPLQHASSLLNQHFNFKKIHKNNKFSEKYMKYLGHYEFGNCHQFWNKPKRYVDINSLNYWLEQWYFFYKDILYKYYIPNKCILVNFESMQNKIFLKSLLNKVEIKENIKSNFVIKEKKLNYSYDDQIYNDASNIYEKIKEKSLSNDV